ncbi:hypothetical protein ACWEV4_13665 [Streptomyces sp. NPDC003860]
MHTAPIGSGRSTRGAGQGAASRPISRWIMSSGGHPPGAAGSRAIGGSAVNTRCKTPPWSWYVPRSRTTPVPHLVPERAVRESGLTWTILRPTWFAENFTELEFFAPLLATGELRLPTGSGREPFVVLQDLVDVAVAALTEDGHAGRTYTLSGPRALNFTEAVAEIAEAAGRSLRFTPVSEEEYRADVATAGYPEDVADLLVTVLHHIRDEGGASVTDGVRQALGHEPRDFSEYVKATDFPAAAPTV